MRGDGFLGTTSSLGADIALLGSIFVAVAFTVGAWLARRGQYEAHRWVQTTAAAVNLLLVLGIMIPALVAVDPSENVTLASSSLLYMTGHEIVGVAALLFGLFVVLRGNNLVPERLKFQNYKPYMRWAYSLYIVATVIGIIVYVVLYT